MKPRCVVQHIGRILLSVYREALHGQLVGLLYGRIPVDDPLDLVHGNRGVKRLHSQIVVGHAEGVHQPFPIGAEPGSHSADHRQEKGKEQRDQAERRVFLLPSPQLPQGNIQAQKALSEDGLYLPCVDRFPQGLNRRDL